MTTIQIIVLAVVQGLTEFLPISSSGHLVLVPYLVEWTDQGLAFDVAVHFGSLLAVVAFFRADIAALLRGGLQLLGGDVKSPQPLPIAMRGATGRLPKLRFATRSSSAWRRRWRWCPVPPVPA